MAFRYLDGDWRRAPFFLPCSGASFADVHLAPGARLGGLTGGDLMPHPGPSTLDALRREMLKGRIREEMRQEMAERRMLEEEVRQEMEEQRMLEREVMQEMEMERAVGLRRLPPIVPLALPPPARLALPLSAMLPMPHGGILVEPCLPVPEPRFVEVREESPVRVRPVPKVWKEPAFSRTDSGPEVDEQERFPEVKQFERKNSGIKRKGAAVVESSKVKRTDGRGLNCALCQVSATSKEGLNDHLQGKKHQAMVTKLASKDTRNKSRSRVASTPKRDEASASTPKAGATLPTEFSDGKKIAMQIDGKLHYVIQKNTFLFCEPCGVKCNSTMMMISHLGGKKHMEWSDGSSKSTIKATTNADAVEDVPAVEGVEEEEA